jgi:hypothetical protein
MAIVLNGATSGNVTIDANAISGTSVITLPVGSGTFPLMNLSTAVATTSGTAIDFTSIPSWVKKITVMFSGVSTNGTNPYLIQVGSGSITSTGYISTGNEIGNINNTAGTSSTAGFVIFNNLAASVRSGHMTISLISGNIWISSSIVKSSTSVVSIGGGDVTLSGVLDRIRITTTTGVDTFDAGSVNILMEGY